MVEANTAEVIVMVTTAAKAIRVDITIDNNDIRVSFFKSHFFVPRLVSYS